MCVGDGAVKWQVILESICLILRSELFPLLNMWSWGAECVTIKLTDFLESLTWISISVPSPVAV